MSMGNFKNNGFLYKAQSDLLVAPMTLACWINRQSLSFEDFALLSRDTTTLDFFAIRLVATTGKVRATVRVGGPTDSSETTTTIGVGEWHHVVGVFASSTSRTIYLDGTPAAENTANASPDLGGTPEVGVGGDSTYGAGSAADAHFAEAGFWDVALTGAEISRLAAGFPCRTVQFANLRYYLPLVGNKTNIVGGGFTEVGTLPPAATHPPVLYA